MRTLVALAIVATCLGCGRVRQSGNDAGDAREVGGEVAPDGGNDALDGGAETEDAGGARHANDANDGSLDGDASRAEDDGSLDGDASDANNASPDSAGAEPVADGGGDTDGSAPPAFTEWQIPFDNSSPAQITAAPGAVFYADFMLLSIGRHCEKA